ncbi:hypothetical protein IU474_08685 [Nocardia otitidiscaviarum]|uniref:hypothetical protein n=1 Tax=Nocardia otitidiscaviarum TaxID=1823 RepID=UPI001894E3B8|nr:hypothetical protein [Nocardia otitidiscaviarum]MBF6237142.1 hypothetical protein [Nocardia otitidiscaviarum]
MTVAVVCALTALVAVWLFEWGRVRYAVVFGAGLGGVAVLCAVAALPAPDEWDEFPIAFGVGLGALIVPAVVLGSARIWFFGALIAAVVLGYQVDNLVDSERYRYRDFPSAVGVNGQSWQLLVALVLVGALLAAMWWWRGERVEPQVSGPSVAVGVGLAVAALLVVWWWAGTGWLPWAAAALAVAVCVAGTRWLPERSAAALAAMTAAAALVVVDPGWDREPSAAGFAVGCAAVVAGLTAGWRVGRPALAVGVCAVAAVGAALSQLSDLGWVRLGAGALVLFAIAMAGASVLSVEPALLAGWTVLPMLAALTARELSSRADADSIPAVIDWAYRPDVYPQSGTVADSSHTLIAWAVTPPPPFVPRPDLVVPGLIVAGACAACAVWLARRDSVS